MLLIALLNLYLQLFLLTSRVACDILCNAFCFTPEKEICTMDMDKNINISLLIDFYGDMLSDKQREAAELYYDEDLSLSEISDITGLTRPGVRDRLVKSERILRDLEEKLGVTFEESEYDTLTGLVFNALGRIPEDGKQSIKLEIEQLRIHVTAISEHQIEAATVEVIPKEQSEQA